MEEADELFEISAEQKHKKRGSKIWQRPRLSPKVSIINKYSFSDVRFKHLARGARSNLSPSRIICRSDIPREAQNEELEILLSPTESQIVVKLTNPWTLPPLVDKRASEKGKRKSKTLPKDALHSGISTTDGKKVRGKKYADEDNMLQASDSEGKYRRRKSKSGKSQKEEQQEEEEEGDFIIDSDGHQVSLTKTPSGHYIDDSGIPAKLKITPSGRMVTEDGRRVIFHRKPAVPKGKFYWKTADGRFIDADGNEGHFHKSPSGRFVNEEDRTGRFKRGSDDSYFFQYDIDKSIRRSSESSRRSSLAHRERLTKTTSGRFVDQDGKETQGPFRRTSSGSIVDGKGRKGRFRLSSSGFYYFDASMPAAQRRKPLGSLLPDSDLFQRTKSGRFLDADGKEGKYRLTPDGRYVDEFGNEVSEEEVLRYYRDGDLPKVDPRAYSLANALYSLSAEPSAARPRHVGKHRRSVDKVGEIGPVNFGEKKMSITFAKTPKPGATKAHSADRRAQLLRADEIELFCTEASELNVSDADSDSILFKIDLEPPPEPKKKKKMKKKIGDPLFRIKGRHQRLPSIFLKTRNIKFKGWDVGFFAKPDAAVRLPDLVDNADALFKYTSRQRKSFVYDEREGTEAHGDSRDQAIQYLAQHGIWELLEFVLFSVAKEKPQNPYDFIIELLRAISRLMNVRSQSNEKIEESLLRATQAGHSLGDKKVCSPGITPMASLFQLDVQRDVSLFPSPVPPKNRLSPVLSRNISGVGGASIWKTPTSSLSMKKETED